MRRTRGKKRIIAVAAITGLMALAAYAYTATNTFSSATNKAGDGNQAISGYVVSSVEYTLNTLDPTKVSAVDFSLDAPAGDVRAKLSDAVGASYYTCAEDADPLTTNRWTCSTGATELLQPTLESINNLRVLAVQ